MLRQNGPDNWLFICPNNYNMVITSNVRTALRSNWKSNNCCKRVVMIWLLTYFQFVQPLYKEQKCINASQSLYRNNTFDCYKCFNRAFKEKVGHLYYGYIYIYIICVIYTIKYRLHLSDTTKNRDFRECEKRKIQTNCLLFCSFIILHRPTFFLRLYCSVILIKRIKNRKGFNNSNIQFRICTGPPQ